MQGADHALLLHAELAALVGVEVHVERREQKVGDALHVEVRAHLAGDEGTPEVWESQEEAARLGITGVPFYVFGGRHGRSDIRPVEIFLRALDAARAERVP